jgi:Mg2+-importing ATPase
VFDLLTFAVLLWVFRAGEATFQTSWFLVSLLTELAVVLVLRTHRPALCSRPSRALLWTTLAVTVATLAIPYLGPLSAMFGFVPLSTPQMAAVLVIVLAYVAATEGAKAWFYRMQVRAEPAIAAGTA